jgi:hypothetical protein
MERKKKKKENSCLVSKWLPYRPLEPHPARASSSLQAVFFPPNKISLLIKNKQTDFLSQNKNYAFKKKTTSVSLFLLVYTFDTVTSTTM